MPDRAPAKGTVLHGKRGLIMGVTNDRSLGWGIAAACAAQGAELAFTYQVEALGRRVRPLAASVGSDQLYLCDVGDAASIDAAFAALRERWERWISSSTRSASPTSSICAAATSTRRARRSSRHSTSRATPSSRSPNAPCR